MWLLQGVATAYALPNVARHQTVDHSLQFKDPVTGVHTERIESYWNQVKTYVMSFDSVHVVLTRFQIQFGFHSVLKPHEFVQIRQKVMMVTSLLVLTRFSNHMNSSRYDRMVFICLLRICVYLIVLISWLQATTGTNVFPDSDKDTGSCWLRDRARTLSILSIYIHP